MSGYNEIINLPHHVSERHARMSMLDRAAQFSPFAALTGYDAAITETARVTESRVELTEDEKAVLDAKLREAMEQNTIIKLTYFLEDDRKSGGAYLETAGRIAKLDLQKGEILLDNQERICIKDIIDILT